MKNKDYLFAVASIRAKENALLSKSDLEQLINAESYNKAAALLGEKGYDIKADSDYSSALDNELTEAWNYVNTSAPENEALKALVIKNDFQNLKAVLKSEVMEYDAKSYLVEPCVVDKNELFEKVSARDFDELPEYIAETAKKALDVLSKTESAQMCDAVIDTAALEAIINFAKSSADEILIKYANEYCVCANIKTAFRAIKTGKSSVFLNTAIAENDLVNKSDFVDAALSGAEGFFEYLSSNGMEDYKAALEKSASAFEKYCDDKMLGIIKKAKMTVFGLSPLAAYFIAKETEIKDLRIILSAKQSFVSSDIIRERMRETYV